MFTKTKIYNLALSALLLTKQIADADSDSSVECRTLNVHWDMAFTSTLEEMDLDSTSSQKNLELITADPNKLWKYAYKYPTDCAFFRRLQSCVRKDVRSTQIAKRVSILNGQKVIFTDEHQALIEYIPNNISPTLLSANAALAVSFRLAMLASPLVAGKYTLKLRQDIERGYGLAVANAKEQDRLENANFDSDEEMSEFVEARRS